MCFSAIHGSGLLLSLNCYISTLRLVHNAALLFFFFRHPHAENPTIQTETRGQFRTFSYFDTTFGIHSHKTLDTAQPRHLLKPPTENFLFSQYFRRQYYQYPVSATVIVRVCASVCARVIVNARQLYRQNNLWTKGCDVIVIKNRCHY